MPTNDDAPASTGPDADDAPTHEDEHTEPFGTDALGTATVRVEIDAETFARLRTAYWRARRRGYSDGFYQFVHNRTRITDETVTVDGDPVEPDVDEWLDLGDGATSTAD